MTLRRTPGSLADVLSRAFQQAGGVKVVADVLPGRDAKRLYEAAGPDPKPKRDTRMFYDEVRLLTRAFPGRVTALAEDLALCAGGVFLPPLDASAGSVAAQASRFGRETGEAMASIFAALEDGSMTRAEAAEALPLVRDALDAAADLYRLVEAVIHPSAEAGQP